MPRADFELLLVAGGCLAEGICSESESEKLSCILEPAGWADVPCTKMLEATDLGRFEVILIECCGSQNVDSPMSARPAE